MLALFQRGNASNPVLGSARIGNYYYSLPVLVDAFCGAQLHRAVCALRSWQHGGKVWGLWGLEPRSPYQPPVPLAHLTCFPCA